MQSVTNPLSSTGAPSTTGAASIGGSTAQHSDLPPPPPRHEHAPAAGSLVQPSLGGGSTQANPSATTGAGSGGGLGAKAGGLFGAIHGAGETLRGTINSTLDGLGDAVAGRSGAPAESRSHKGDGEQVAQKGVEEVREGYGRMAGSGTGATGTGATH